MYRNMCRVKRTNKKVGYFWLFLLVFSSYIYLVIPFPFLFFLSEKLVFPPIWRPSKNYLVTSERVRSLLSCRQIHSIVIIIPSYNKISGFFFCISLICSQIGSLSYQFLLHHFKRPASDKGRGSRNYFLFFIPSKKNL